MKIVRVALGMLGGAMFASSALATDLGLPPPVSQFPVTEAQPDWTGLYIGAHAGGAWADWDVSIVAPGPGVLIPESASLSGAGGAAGLQAGVNYQTGDVVFGGEADVSWASLSASGLFVTQKYIDNAGTDGTSWLETHDLDMFGTVRGRFGVVNGNWLFYGTGGWAWAKGSNTHTVADGANPPHSVTTVGANWSGYAIGAGAEWMMSQNVTLKLEYLYMGFGSQTFTHDINAGAPDVTSASLKLQTVRVGVNYKFGGQ
jgi:outer membrane immunogenic protein